MRSLRGLIVGSVMITKTMAGDDSASLANSLDGSSMVFSSHNSTSSRVSGHMYTTSQDGGSSVGASTAVEKEDFLLREPMNRKDLMTKESTAASDADGSRSLVSAAKQGNERTAQNLIATRKDLDVNKEYEIGQKKRTALMAAAEGGHDNIVDLLLPLKRLNVNKADSSKGRTAFMLACQYNFVNVVKKLLNHSDIDINKTDKKKWTALIFACHEGYHEVVQELLNHPKIDLNVQDGKGLNALMHACYKYNGNNYLQVIKHLVNRGGINLNALSSKRKTVLQIADEKNSRENFDQIKTVLGTLSHVDGLATKVGSMNISSSSRSASFDDDSDSESRDSELSPDEMLNRLTEEQFIQMIGMPRADFNKLPKFKQQQIKKKLGLL